MDGLFEILIILAFFLLPVLEGILKKRRREQSGEEAGPEAGPAPDDRRREGEEPTSSEEMIPEDFWEELTRGTADEAPREPEPRGEPAPWEGGEAEGAGGVPEEADRERSPGTWIAEPPAGEVDARADGERGGPPATDEEARREAFRREIAAGASGAGDPRRRRASELRRVRSGRMARRGRAPAAGAHPLLGAMDQEALRRAVVWREVLGPPVALRHDEP